jgi:hypothetical protein
MIEAAILLKPVFSILAPEFVGTQEGTLHFRYLLPENGGFLRAASSIEEHVTQLTAVLDNPADVRQRTEQFVTSFLRPRGVTDPCTPILAGELERLARSGEHAPERGGAGVIALRTAIAPIAVAASLVHVGGDLPGKVWKAAYRGGVSLAGGTRSAFKRLIVRPARLTVWAAGTAHKRARRALRQLRYHVAVRVRRITSP